MCGWSTHAMPCVSRSEGNAAESLFSFRLCVHPRNRTQVIALVWQNFYLLSHLCRPVRLFLVLCVSIETFCGKSTDSSDDMRLAHAPLSFLHILTALKGKTSGSKFLCKEECGPALSDQLHAGGLSVTETDRP